MCFLFQQAYEFFDGFVVLHGTDTMSYTASALSFMLENLGKTVVITGAQVSIVIIKFILCSEITDTSLTVTITVTGVLRW